MAAAISVRMQDVLSRLCLLVLGRKDAPLLLFLELWTSLFRSNWNAIKIRRYLLRMLAYLKIIWENREERKGQLISAVTVSAPDSSSI